MDITIAIVLGILLACIGEAGAWFIISYPNLYSNLKNSMWPLLITSPIVSFCYWKATKYIYESTGSFWSAKILFFSTGIIVFGVLTYIFFNEPITLKTFVTISLAILIIYIQVYT